MIISIIKKNMQNNEWLDNYVRQGYSFFNTGTKQKKIFTKWSEFQNRKPTEEEITKWLTLTPQNYAIVCGKISNLVVFDVDTKNGGDFTPFLGYDLFEIKTPSGGRHFYTTYDSIFENTKHFKNDGILKAVDIQSNGSLVFAPPSFFSNGGYTIINDTPIKPLPTKLLLKILADFKQEKEKEYVPFVPKKNPENGRPGDIFNALASWDEVLLPQGWKKVGRERNNMQYWRRPGKRSGISATTNHKGYDLLFCFSSSTPLNSQKGYTKFNALATLKYDGDYQRTAKELVMVNYRKALL